MFVFEFDAVLFRFKAQGPAHDALSQFAPHNKATP